MQWEVDQPDGWKDDGFKILCTTFVSKLGAAKPFIRHVLKGTGQVQLSARSSMLLDPVFLSQNEAECVQRDLDDHVHLFVRPVISVYGKQTMIPRSQIAFGDGMYHYSNIAVDAHPSPPSIARFLLTIQQLTGDPDYCFALVNRYEGGIQKIGRHSDDEASLARGAPIISYSVGQSRRFVIRPKKCMNLATKRDRDHQQQSKAPAGPSTLNAMFTPSECPGIPSNRIDLQHVPYHRVSIEVSVSHNTMIAMSGAFQRDFVHEVPEEKSVTGVRYNITARCLAR
jgi:alkylated DNA repair dioxygenase AlkB